MRTKMPAVSWRPDGELRRFGYVLGRREDGMYEVSDGYRGVVLLQPNELTWEES